MNKENKDGRKYVNSPILGTVARMTKEERVRTDSTTENFPLDVFQSVNKHFNKLGLMLQIGVVAKQGEEKSDD